MFKAGLSMALLLAAISGAAAAESDKPVIVTQHEIPLDRLGNVVRITGHANPKSDVRPNGSFAIRFPGGEGRGVQAIAGKVAVSGAVIRGMKYDRMIKSTVDHVAINSAGTAVDFATHSQRGSLTLPLVAEKDGPVVVVVYLETSNGSVGFRYFLTPRGLSAEPEPAPKKREAKK
jgi:hypothetical protein